MLLLSSDWSTVWTMAGMGIGVVFVILVLLVLVLQVFSYVAANATIPHTAHHAAAAEACRPVEQASEDEKAAIATALYLYFNNTHDEESGILTIHVEDHPAWHAVLNPNNI